jgi:hypothetical protein
MADAADEAAAISRGKLLKHAPEDRLPAVEGVAKFMRVNGVPQVRYAMQQTTKRLELAARGGKTPVENPWDYVRAIVNGAPARARYIFLLLFLWETSLRSRVDLVMRAQLGNDWFRDPGTYLSEKNARWLFDNHDQRERLFVVDAGAKFGRRIAPSILYSDGLLDELYLEGLHNVVADSWPLFRSVFLPTTGTKVHLDTALHTAVRVRRLTMHAHVISNAMFRESADALRLLLQALEFDVDKTLKRIEKRDPYQEDLDLFEGGVPAPPVVDA